ncbi:ABC-type sugar transport system permease subunit [Parapusillimonas granuli]|nr:ABC-type sugar transport system permease subunit [Parapusillimonas granuli]
MDKEAIHEPSLYKLIILVACIVVAMFFATALVALVFMPNQLIAGMLFEDIAFLLPLALSTLCSASVLAWYVQSHRCRSKR